MFINHPTDERLQSFATGQGDAETSAHVTECEDCQSIVEAYRLVAATVRRSESNTLSVTEAVMSRVHSLEQRRAERKEGWMMAALGLAAVVATVYFTSLSDLRIETDTATDWVNRLRDKVGLTMDGTMALVGNNLHLVLAAIAIVLAFEWIDRFWIRRIHSH